MGAIKKLKDQFIALANGGETSKSSPFAVGSAPILNAADRREGKPLVRLWDEHDARIDQSMFQGTVPSLILGVDQKIIEFNEAFHMIFGVQMGLKRGSHVSDWYKVCENFKRLPARQQELYGDALIPLSDRQRVVFNSSEFGRMVFFKIMTPLTDRSTGRVLGWSIALNINSVHHRNHFFERLHRLLSEQSLRSRYVASVAQILKQVDPFHHALTSAARAYAGKKVLVLGAMGTVAYVEQLVAAGARCDVLDTNPEGLRLMRHLLVRESDKLMLVRPRNVSGIELYMHSYDGVIVDIHALSSLIDQNQFMSKVFQSLRHGGRIELFGREMVEHFQDTINLRNFCEGKGAMDQLRWNIPIVNEFTQTLRYKDCCEDFLKLMHAAGLNSSNCI
jgi:hypothetical protein